MMKLAVVVRIYSVLIIIIQETNMTPITQESHCEKCRYAHTEPCCCECHKVEERCNCHCHNPHDICVHCQPPTPEVEEKVETGNAAHKDYFAPPSTYEVNCSECGFEPRNGHSFECSKYVEQEFEVKDDIEKEWNEIDQPEVKDWEAEWIVSFVEYATYKEGYQSGRSRTTGTQCCPGRY